MYNHHFHNIWRMSSAYNTNFVTHLMQHGPHLAALEAGHARRPLQPGVPLLARLAHGTPRPRHPVPARARVALLALAAFLARAARLALLAGPTCYDMT